jgi:HSF-type DNA-binding
MMMIQEKHVPCSKITYRDYADTTESDSPEQRRTSYSRQEPCVEKVKLSNGHRTVGENFPAKLHYILSEIERDGFEHIISWQPHGRCFMIRKPNELEQKILPLYVKKLRVTTAYIILELFLTLYSFVHSYI